MRTKFATCGTYVIIRENERFGLTDSEGALLLSAEYESIFTHGKNDFLLCQQGKWGYVKFGESPWDGGKNAHGGALAWLPCLYDRIVERQNGLSLWSMCKNEPLGKESWFDFESGILYRGLAWMQNYEDFDGFLVEGAPMPMLKRRGKDEWVKLPKDACVEFMSVAYMDATVRVILCHEFIGEKENDAFTSFKQNTILVAKEKSTRAKCRDEYYCLLLYKNGWTMTTPCDIDNFEKSIPLISEKLKTARKNGNEMKSRVLIKYKPRYGEWENV